MSAHDQDSNTPANIITAVTLVGVVLSVLVLVVWLG